MNWFIIPDKRDRDAKRYKKLRKKPKPRGGKSPAVLRKRNAELSFELKGVK